MARLVLRASDCAPSSSGRRPAGARGYLIVEAAMALPVYLLFMLLVMKLSAVAVAQAKVTVAVNQAAIALSQASYVRSAAVTSDAADVIDLVEDLVGRLGSNDDVFGLNGSDNALALMVNDLPEAELASRAVAGQLESQDALLKALGVVEGAEGVTFDPATVSVVTGDRVVLDAQYDVRLWFFGDHSLAMRAHAESTRWGTVGAGDE
ncbi:hypothetical protein SAMN04488035_0404 [Flavimobilis marinus]|uniref:TadE-like protein n=1 Tax=Flavimobilis marinus TaxID=285351 RepID=A0A1I2D4P2_9MICO|nr:hypothetical protein [Flavimobilis marinus]SFE75469.1 hypothetical protein SAMN04488035_0404 [Flavimobilis marinus]